MPFCCPAPQLCRPGSKAADEQDSAAAPAHSKAAAAATAATAAAGSVPTLVTLKGASSSSSGSLASLCDVADRQSDVVAQTQDQHTKHEAQGKAC